MVLMVTSTLYCDSCGTANRREARFCFSCGQSLQAVLQFAQASSSGEVTGSPTGNLLRDHLLKRRYRVLSQLGKGGMGAVYKAEDVQFGNRLVAVKEMSQSWLPPQEIAVATEAFKREALLLAGLRHPHIPRTYDHFFDGGRWYLVMDFIDGQTLEEYLNSGNFRARKRRLPVDEVLDIGIQLSAMLDYLHNCQPPVIFRDLKPANIMLAPEGRLYLFDFGIARHFKPGQTRDTATFGSVGYAAPEQYGRAQTTPRSDIYSLGATLHQLLSGRDPALTPFRFVPLHLPNQAPLVELEQLITRMVDIDEYIRPGSMAVVKQELQRIAVERTTGRANGAQLADKGASLEDASVDTAFPAQGTTLSVYHGHALRVLAVAWSPDSKQLVSGSGDCTVHVWDAVSGRGVVNYHGHAEWVKAVAWSPSGSRIASAGADGTVQVWDAITGRNALIYRGHTNIVSALAWSPDGSRIASGGYDKVIHIWDASDGERLFSYDDHDGIVNTVAWSPDGIRVASASDDHTVHVWPVTAARASGANTRNLAFIYLGHKDKVSAVAWSPNGKRLCSGSWDNTVQVWDANTGSYVFTHSGHSSWINAVAWSPIGTHIASASNDKTVQVWEVGSGREYFTKRVFFTYYGHTEWVRDVAWSPEGQYIASGGHDETVRVWQAR